MKVKCLKKLETKHMTFKEGEVYEMEKINDSWVIIEAIGVPSKSVPEYFEVQ
jgi:hypothetical protein